MERLRSAPNVSDNMNVTGCGQGALKNQRANTVERLWHCMTCDVTCNV
jgi:hypothetical protein